MRSLINLRPQNRCDKRNTFFAAVFGRDMFVKMNGFRCQRVLVILVRCERAATFYGFPSMHHIFSTVEGNLWRLDSAAEGEGS